MIVDIGLSLMLRYIYQFFIGGGTTQLPYSTTAKIPLFGVVPMSIVDMVSFAICIVVIVGFALWLTYSRTGKATRAISDNSSLAAASGIDVDAVVRVVWVIAGLPCRPCRASCTRTSVQDSGGTWVRRCCSSCSRP